MTIAPVLRSILQCPCCGFKVTERMPMMKPLREYRCEACQKAFELAPEQCCVFCIYGSVPCPEQQEMAAK